jgi:uncharacterized protein YceK
MENLQEVSQAQAVADFAGLGPEMDPDGIATPETVAEAGQCFTLTTEEGWVTFSASGCNSVLWIHAAKGQGAGMTRAGLACVERMARHNRLQYVEFQTLRLGLVHIAEKHGYSVARRQGRGYVMQKAIQ